MKRWQVHNLKFREDARGKTNMNIKEATNKLKEAA